MGDLRRTPAGFLYAAPAFALLGLVLFSIATETWMMFVFMVPYCLGGIAGPALQAIISGKVPSNEQGQLQGALASLMSATSIIGPPIMTNLFAFFTRPSAPVQFAGAPFFLAAILMLASTIIAYTTIKNKKYQSSFMPTPILEKAKPGVENPN